MTPRSRAPQTSRTVQPNSPQNVQPNSPRPNTAGTFRVRRNSWQIWIMIIISISIIYELTGPHHASCDWFHATKKVKHRDVVADLAKCQESSGRFGKCLSPASYDAVSLTTQLVQRIPQVQGPPFPTLPLPYHRPDLHLWRFFAGKSSFQLGQLSKNNLTNFQISALIKWQSCSIPTKQENYLDLDTTCAFTVFDNLFFGGSLRPHVAGPTWEPQPPQEPDLFIDSHDARTKFHTDPLTTTSATIYLRLPTHALYFQPLHTTTLHNVQQTLADLLSEMIKAFLQIYTCPLCNISPSLNDVPGQVKFKPNSKDPFLPCLLNRTLGATPAGPAYRRLKRAVQASAPPALSSRLPQSMTHENGSRPWSHAIGTVDDRHLAIYHVMEYMRRNYISSSAITYEDWAVVLSESGVGGLGGGKEDVVLEYLLGRYVERAEEKSGDGGRKGHSMVTDKGMRDVARKVEEIYGSLSGGWEI